MSLPRPTATKSYDYAVWGPHGDHQVRWVGYDLITLSKRRFVVRRYTSAASHDSIPVATREQAVLILHAWISPDLQRPGWVCSALPPEDLHLFWHCLNTAYLAWQRYAQAKSHAQRAQRTWQEVQRARRTCTPLPGSISRVQDAYTEAVQRQQLWEAPYRAAKARMEWELGLRLDWSAVEQAWARGQRMPTPAQVGAKPQQQLPGQPSPSGSSQHRISSR